MIFAERRTYDTHVGKIVGGNGNLRFRYAIETPRRYEQYGALIEGMVHNKGSLAISTSSRLAFQLDDVIELEGGKRYKVKGIETTDAADRRHNAVGTGRRTLLLE